MLPRNAAAEERDADSAMVHELQRHVQIGAFSGAMTACRSSRFFELTRISSPWTWVLTPAGALVPDDLVDLLGVLGVDACGGFPLTR